MKITLQKITPELAALWLENNAGNRAISIAHVDRLKKEIVSGRWKVNGDAIRISKTGRVLDGQHRLTAIVKSGMEIDSLVLYDVDDNVFDTIDIGKRRSAGDTLGCIGEKNSYRLAAALILVDKYHTGTIEKGVTYSNGEILELLEKYPDVRDYIHTVIRGVSLMPPAVIDACHYLFSRKDKTMADAFIQKLLRGSELDARDPVYVLRERLIQNSVSKAKLTKAHLFALCIRAWNHARSGNKINHLKLYEKDGKLTEFPVVQ